MGTAKGAEVHLQQVMGGHYMSGMTFYLAKHVVTLFIRSGENLVRREVCSNTSHALKMEQGIKKTHVPSHGNFQPTPNTLLFSV